MTRCGSIIRLSVVYRSLLILFIISVPMTSAFSLRPWMPLPLVILMIFLVVYVCEVLLSGNVIDPVGFPSDALIVGFVFAMVLSSVINVDIFAYRQLRHLFSYLAVIAAYYLGSRMLIQKANISIRQLMKWLTVAVVLAALFAIVEFAGKNVIGFDVDEWVPRSDLTQYNPVYAGMLIRARSFMSESGNYALFLEIFTPLAVAHLMGLRSKVLGMLIAGIILAGLIVSFSAAAVASLTIGIVFALLHYGLRCVPRMRVSYAGLRNGLLAVALLGFMGVTVALNPENAFVTGIVDKLTLGGTTSVSDRFSRWSQVYAIVMEHPLFGLGAGGFLDPRWIGYGIVSWWLQMLVEGGIVATVLFLGFYLSVLIKAGRLQNNRRYAYVVSLVAAAVHYSVISDYWLPWIWLLFVIVLMDSDRSSQFSVDSA